MRKTFYWIFALAIVALMASSVQAWPVAHVGYTHVGPGGVQHWGRTAGFGPYGGFSTGSARGHGWGGGGYHAGYAYGGRYGGGYGGAAYGGYHYGGYGGYGGFHYGYGGAYGGGYRAGYYRRW